MAARDGSMSFDLEGIYARVKAERHLAYTLADGREVTVDFTPVKDGTEIVQCFEPEATNPSEMQRAGWQAILDNFKAYVLSVS